MLAASGRAGQCGGVELMHKAELVVAETIVNLFMMRSFIVISESNMCRAPRIRTTSDD
jgi:hypothetical protein